MLHNNNINFGIFLKMKTILCLQNYKRKTLQYKIKWHTPNDTILIEGLCVKYVQILTIKFSDFHIR